MGADTLEEMQFRMPQEQTPSKRMVVASLMIGAMVALATVMVLRDSSAPSTPFAQVEAAGGFKESTESMDVDKLDGARLEALNAYLSDLRARRSGYEVPLDQNTEYARRAGSGAGSGSGSGSATTAPTAAPAGTATVSATITFNNINPSDFTGNVKIGYEKGFGKNIGIVTCANNVCSYLADCSVAGTATAVRRAASVSFEASVADPSGVDTSTISSATVTASSVATSISEVASGDATLAADNAFTNSVPTASDITVASVSVSTAAPTSAPASSGGDDDTGLIVGVVIGSVVGVALLAAIAVVVVMNSGGETVAGTSMQMGNAEGGSTFVEQQAPGVKPTQT